MASAVVRSKAVVVLFIFTPIDCRDSVFSPSYVALPHGAMGWSAACEFGITSSYSLTFFHVLIQMLLIDTQLFCKRTTNLIIAYVAHSLKCIIAKLDLLHSKFQYSIRLHWSQTWSQIMETDFLVIRLILSTNFVMIFSRSMWFWLFLVACCFLLFFLNQLLKQMFNSTRASNSLDPEQAWHFVRPYLGSRFLFRKNVSR